MSGKTRNHRRGKYQQKIIRSRQLPLAINDLKRVRSETYEVRSKWYDIGMELGMSDGTLQSIKNENTDNSSHLTNMYSHWLKTVDPKPTWKALVTALEQPAVGECDLADALRQKYCPSAAKRRPSWHRRYSSTHTSAHYGPWQKVLKFVWSYKVQLGLLFVILCGIAVLFKILYNYYPAVIEQNGDKLLPYQHSDSVLKENPYAKLSRTLPQHNKRIIFSGRDEELKNLTELIKPMSPTCTVSITGSPGFGKSTLAIHAGYEAENLNYTVVYVDLVEAHNLHLVKQEIVSRVNHEEGTSISDIAEWSIKNTTVLILDNCDSVLHKHMGGFQTLLKSLCRHSTMLKVVMTSKHETLFVDALEHMQIKELQTNDAVRVLTEISSRINTTFAHKLAKRVGNVPLALQVVGTLLKDNSRSSEQFFSQLQRDIIEALSPKELPVEDRVKTSMEVSYSYLFPEKFQVCGCILSKFPVVIREGSAHFILNKLVDLYMSKPGKIVWTLRDTKECLNLLVRRSLLNFNYADELYRFHQLVREFFLRQRERKSLLNTKFRENLLFQLAFGEYSLRQYSKVLSASKSASCSPDEIRHSYTEAIKELPNHKHVIPKLYQQSYYPDLIIDDVLSKNKHPFHLSALGTLYLKIFSRSLFESIFCKTYILLFEMDTFRSEMLQKFGPVNYFRMYVTLLMDLCRLETHVYNSSFALQNLHKKSRFGNITELYHSAKKNNSIESHHIYAEYYTMLAKMYIKLKDFDSFMECWQKLLYLRVYKSKCEKQMHQCTTIQHGLAAFGRRKYNLTISYLEPHLYSMKIPLHRRARLFVLVCYSYIQLGRPEMVEQLLSRSDDIYNRAVVIEVNERVYVARPDQEIEHQYVVYLLSISEELALVKLGVTDDVYYDSWKNSRALMIFGNFLEKYATQTDTRKLGIVFQRKAKNFVHFHTFEMFNGIRKQKLSAPRKEIAY